MTSAPGSSREHDLALLRTTADRHAHSTPLPVLHAIDTAVDTLADPCRLPALPVFTDGDTEDLAGVLAEVRDRLLASIASAPDPVEAMALGWAGRHLTTALDGLLGVDATDPRPW